MVSPEELHRVFANSSMLYSAAQIEKAVEQMAANITQNLHEQNPIILCVMIGGLVPTGMLLKHLSFPLVLDYIHATRYKGGTQGKELDWLVTPKTPLKDRVVLVVDDILDGGITLGKIIEWCKAQGASDVQSAVLVDKEDTRLEGGLPAANYVGLTVPNLYVFGYGMDYKNYLRNAPGIYAVDEKDLI